MPLVGVIPNPLFIAEVSSAAARSENAFYVYYTNNGRCSPGSRRISRYSSASTTAIFALPPWSCASSVSSRPAIYWKLRGSPGSTTTMRRLAVSLTGCGGAVCTWVCCNGRRPNGWASPRPFKSTWRPVPANIPAAFAHKSSIGESLLRAWENENH